MRTLSINVFLGLWCLPFIGAFAFWCGTNSIAAWIFAALIAVFAGVNVAALGMTFRFRKEIAVRPAPPIGGFRRAIVGVILWSILFSGLWTVGWFVSAIIAAVSLFSLVMAVSIARGRSRGAATI
jgi:hypothetical protein